MSLSRMDWLTLIRETAHACSRSLRHCLNDDRDLSELTRSEACWGTHEWGACEADHLRTATWYAECQPCSRWQTEVTLLSRRRCLTRWHASPMLDLTLCCEWSREQPSSVRYVVIYGVAEAWEEHDAWHRRLITLIVAETRRLEPTVVPDGWPLWLWDDQVLPLGLTDHMMTKYFLSVSLITWCDIDPWYWWYGLRMWMTSSWWLSHAIWPLFCCLSLSGHLQWGRGCKRGGDGWKLAEQLNVERWVFWLAWEGCRGTWW